MIKSEHSTGLFKFLQSSEVSLTSLPHEPIVVVHQATLQMVANHLHKTGKWGTVTPANKNLVRLFFEVWENTFLFFGVLNGNLGYVGS